MPVENEASVQLGQKTPAKIAKASSKPMEEVKLDPKIDPRVSVEGISREMVQENMNAGGVMTKSQHSLAFTKSKSVAISFYEIKGDQQSQVDKVQTKVNSKCTDKQLSKRFIGKSEKKS